jgi:hypothetical protein
MLLFSLGIEDVLKGNVPGMLAAEDAVLDHEVTAHAALVDRVARALGAVCAALGFAGRDGGDPHGMHAERAVRADLGEGDDLQAAFAFSQSE